MSSHCGVDGAELLKPFLKSPYGQAPLQQHSFGGVSGDRAPRSGVETWSAPESLSATMDQALTDGSRGSHQMHFPGLQGSRGLLRPWGAPEDRGSGNAYHGNFAVNFDSGWDSVQDGGHHAWDAAGPSHNSVGHVDMATRARQQIDEFDTLIEKIDHLNDLSLGSPAGHLQKQPVHRARAAPQNLHQDSVDDDLQYLLEQNPSLLDPLLSSGNRFTCDSGIGASLVTTSMTPCGHSCMDGSRTGVMAPDGQADTMASSGHADMMASGGHADMMTPDGHADMVTNDGCGNGARAMVSDCGTDMLSQYSRVEEGGHAALLTQPVSPMYRHLEEHQAASSYYRITTPTPIKRPGPPSLKQATMSTRTNLKQYLQMQQVQEQERREQEQAKQATAAPSKNTQAVSVPPTTIAPPRMDVPSEVLKVNSRLENPTQFHVLESRKRQVQEYLSTAQGNGRSLLAQSVPGKGGAQGTSAPASAVASTSQQHLSNSAPSPDSPNSVALSSSATSASEADVIETIMQMESSMDTDGTGFLQTSTMPTDSNYLDLISSCGVPSPTSSQSCPSDGNMKQEAFRFGDCSMQAMSKDRQKKDNHNMIERRRRFNINDRIKELATLLPKSNDPYFDVVRLERQNKGTILKASVDFIKELKKEVDRLSIEAKERKRLENENWKLRHQNQQLLNARQQPTSESTPDITYLLTAPTLTSLKQEEGPVYVKQEPIDLLADHSHQLLSPTSMDDLMEDDRHHVNGDPMMPCPLINNDVLLSEGMEFTS